MEEMTALQELLRTRRPVAWDQLPDIPLYSNYYYDVYNANIENFVTSPFFGPANAILYANIKGY